MPSDRPTLRILLSILLASTCAAVAGAGESTDHWAQWRGPLATGEAPTATPPVRWSEEENVRWKAAIPGRGSSTPIVWGDRIYLTTAIPVKGESEATEEGPVLPSVPIRFVVLALDRSTGDVVWERTAREAVPHEGTHSHGTWASCSPVTDGDVLIASFGSNGIYAFDLDGKPLWDVDLGDMSTRRGFGEGASPVIHDDTVVVNWDHEGDSFIVALDKRTGQEKWRRDRDEPTSWATPLVVESAGKDQVIVNATNLVRSYDVDTGDVLWSTSGMTVNTIPSPVFADGVVYVMSGFRGNALKAIRLAHAEGNFIDGDAISWTFDRDTPYVPSPLLYQGNLYMLKHNKGILTAFDAASGDLRYGPERIGVDGVYASPVGADGRVYIASREGEVVVLGAGTELEILATNSLDDGFDASPAVVGDEIFLRGRKHLYCLGETGEKASQGR